MPTRYNRSAGWIKQAVTFGILLPVFTIAVALLTVDHDPVAPYHQGNFSPFGYTWSLLLFLVPCVSLAIWFHRHRLRQPHQWGAFWLTAGFVVPAWCLLDIFLGNTFFVFPNPGATIGIYAPAYTPGHGWSSSIPIEEFVFYITGSMSILLGYIWSSESWLSAYTLSYPDYMSRVPTAPPMLTVPWKSLALIAAMFAFALGWKKLGPHPDHDGFPAYFLFELALVVLPVAISFPAVAPFLNVPAFVFKTLTLVLTSLLWEVTLALPYGWWGYRHGSMMGIYIRPWFGLPLEAAVLWPSAAWMNVCLYEALKLYLRSGKSLREFLLGAGAPATSVR
jgi:hypothetical protein